MNSPLHALLSRSAYLNSVEYGVEGFLGCLVLLLERGVDVNALSSSRKTPLALAVGVTGAVKLLLSHHADVNALSRGSTPLHLASNNGCIHSARLLLLAGANLHARDARGKTAADLAAAARKPRTVAFLSSGDWEDVEGLEDERNDSDFDGYDYDYDEDSDYDFNPDGYAEDRMYSDENYDGDRWEHVYG